MIRSRAPSFGVRRNKTSRFSGVTRFRASRKYEAYVTIDGKRIHLGMWDSERDAAVAHDRAALYFDIRYAKHNLPATSRKLGPANPNDLRRMARLAAKKTHHSSRYIGVVLHPSTGRWLAMITWGRDKQLQIAKFDNEKDAAIAYDRVALHMFGKNAIVNFPKRSTPGSLKEVRREAWRLAKLRTTSKYRGVSWKAAGSCWIAQITSDYKKLHLGSFASEGEAAVAYDRAAKKFLGSQAKLNFPDARG